MTKTLKTYRHIPATLLLTASLMAMPPISIANAQTAPAVTPAAAALSEGTVKALQDALNKQGIAVTTNGVLDEETRNAIRTFQSRHHLPVTGDTDKATLDKLGIAAQSGAIPAPSPTVGQATSPSTGQMTPSQMPMQSGQGSGGMMSGPMMQEMMQGMMKTMQGMMGMMQGQMQQPSQMQPGQAQSGRMQRGPMQGAQGGSTTNCPMMLGSDQASGPAMMQMMQGMMQMMQMMQNQMQPGQRP